jgi:spore germination protein
MFFILVLTLSAYSIIPLANRMAETAGTGAWLSLLATSLIFMLPLIGIVHLNNLFKGKTLFDYAPRLIGKAGAYLVSMYYVMFFLLFLFYLVLEVGVVLKADFFPRTPLWVIGLVCIPVFIYISHKGVTTVARMCEIIGMIFIITGVLVHILMITQGKLNRILPLFSTAEIDNYLRGIKPAILPFIPMSLLLAIPFSKQNGKKAVKTAVLTILFLVFFYILVVESCIMKVGLSDIVNYKDSLIVAIRDTAPKFFEFFTRLDILYLTVGMTGLFMGVIVIITVLLEFLCRMFANVKRGYFSVALGVMAFVAYLILIGITDFDLFILDIEPFLVFVSVVLIPSTLLIVAKVKKAGKQGRKDAV